MDRHLIATYAEGDRCLRYKNHLNLWFLLFFVPFVIFTSFVVRLRV